MQSEHEDNVTVQPGLFVRELRRISLSLDLLFSSIQRFVVAVCALFDCKQVLSISVFSLFHGFLKSQYFCAYGLSSRWFSSLFGLLLLNSAAAGCFSRLSFSLLSALFKFLFPLFSLLFLSTVDIELERQHQPQSPVNALLFLSCSHCDMTCLLFWQPSSPPPDLTGIIHVLRSPCITELDSSSLFLIFCCCDEDAITLPSFCHHITWLSMFTSLFLWSFYVSLLCLVFICFHSRSFSRWSCRWSCLDGSASKRA